MPTLYRVDAVLSFASSVAPVDVTDVERLVAGLDLPGPAPADGREDPSGGDVRVDEDGTGADVVVLVEAEDDAAAQEVVEAAVEGALARSPWDRGDARLDSLRVTAAYDL